MLPPRSGPRPHVTPCAPHAQLDQFPNESLTRELIARVRALEGVSFGTSMRAPPGTVGFFLRNEDPRGREDDFMLGQEFAHVHPDPDGSLHLVLAEPLRSQAVQAGWVEVHPLAGRPTVPIGIVLAYAPRNKTELDLVFGLVEASWRQARGPRAAVT